MARCLHKNEQKSWSKATYAANKFLIIAKLYMSFSYKTVHHLRIEESCKEKHTIALEVAREKKQFSGEELETSGMEQAHQTWRWALIYEDPQIL